MLTSHQLLKLAALVMMTVDHVGAYLYPDDLAWRSVGRIVVPVWFFLVGHAIDYRSRRDLYVWALVLATLNPFLGEGLFPLNSLITIALLQWLLRIIERRGWFDSHPWTLIAASIVLLIPSSLLSEYGSAAFLFALMGHAVRTGHAKRWRGAVTMVAAVAGFFAVTWLNFDFNPAQWILAMSGVAVVSLGLRHFRYRTFTAPRIIAAPIGFIAHHSMQYYVVHRVVLQALGVTLGALKPGLRLV